MRALQAPGYINSCIKVTKASATSVMPSILAMALFANLLLLSGCDSAPDRAKTRELILETLQARKSLGGTTVISTYQYGCFTISTYLHGGGSGKEAEDYLSRAVNAGILDVQYGEPIFIEDRYMGQHSYDHPYTSKLKEEMKPFVLTEESFQSPYCFGSSHDPSQRITGTRYKISTGSVSDVTITGMRETEPGQITVDYNFTIEYPPIIQRLEALNGGTNIHEQKIIESKAGWVKYDDGWRLEGYLISHE